MAKPRDTRKPVESMSPFERRAEIDRLRAKRAAKGSGELVISLTMSSSDVRAMIANEVEDQLGGEVRELVAQEVARQTNVAITSRLKRPSFRAQVAEIVAEVIAAQSRPSGDDAFVGDAFVGDACVSEG